MPTTQDTQRLRSQVGDDVMFNNLMQSDPTFRTKVENVQKAYPNMSPFEKAKFPSAMIDIHLGTAKGAPKGVAEQNSQSLNRGMTEEMRPKGAWDTLTQDPLIFAGQTAKNVIPSTARLIGGVAGMVAHPLQSGKSLFQLGVGGAVNTLEKIADLAGVQNAEEIFDLESEEVASAVGDFYAERYGSLEQAAETLRSDPAGFLSDFGAVVSGIGSLAKGAASVTQAGVRGATAGMSAVPLASDAARIGQMASRVGSVGSKALNAGIKMEPLVITGRGVMLVGGKIRSGMGGLINAEKQMSSALKLHPTMNRKFMEPTMSMGKTPARYAIEKGVTGSTIEEVAEKFQKIAEKSKATVDSKLASFRQTYDVTDIAGVNNIRVHDILLEILKKYEASPVGNEEIIAHVKALLKQERMTLSEINGVKRMASDSFKLFEGVENVSGKQGLENLYSNVQGFIEEQAALKGFDDIGILNKDTQLSTFMQKALEKSATSKYGNNILSLTNSILATGGGSIGTMVGGGGFGMFAAAGILLTRKIAGSVRFKTTLAKYLSRITPAQRRAIENAVKTGKHTKESRIILRRVTAQTAEDIKNQRIGEMEAIAPRSTATRESRLLGKESTSPSTIQEGMSTVNAGEQRLAGLKGGDDIGNKYGIKRTDLEGKLSTDDALAQAGLDSGWGTLADGENVPLEKLSQSAKDYLQESAIKYMGSGDPVIIERFNRYVKKGDVLTEGSSPPRGTTFPESVGGQGAKGESIKVLEDLGFSNPDEIIPLKLDGKTVGGVDATPSRFVENRLDVHYVRILPEAQKKGVGTRAINQLFQDNPNVNEIVGHATAESRPFWKKVGAKFSSDDSTAFTIDRPSLPSSSNITTDIAKAKASGMSFDEWVKGQEEGLYIHGSPTKIEGKLELKSKALGVQQPEANAVDVIYLTPNTSTGRMHSRMYTKQNGVTYAVRLKSNAKIFDYTNPAHRKMIEKTMTDAQKKLVNDNLVDGQLLWAATPPVKNVKKLGFDGMKQIERKKGDMAFSETFGDAKYPENAESLMLFNKDVFEQVDVVKTRSQLRAEWDKVAGIPKELDALAKEARKVTVPVEVSPDGGMGGMPFAERKYRGLSTKTVMQEAETLSGLLESGNKRIGIYRIEDIEPLIKNNKITLFHGGESDAMASIKKSGLKNGSFLGVTKKESEFYSQLAKKYGKDGDVISVTVPIENIAINPKSGELMYFAK